MLNCRVLYSFVAFSSSVTMILSGTSTIPLVWGVILNAFSTGFTAAVAVYCHGRLTHEDTVSP